MSKWFDCGSLVSVQASVKADRSGTMVLLPLRVRPAQFREKTVGLHRRREAGLDLN
jgi:hypothetical protein